MQYNIQNIGKYLSNRKKKISRYNAKLINVKKYFSILWWGYGKASRERYAKF